MKRLLRRLLSGTCLIASVGFLISNTFGQVTAFDSATNYTSGWKRNGLAAEQNLGFGFQPWSLVHSSTGGGFSGFFIGNSGGQNGITQPPGNAFGLFANGSGTNQAVAFRGFSNSLTTNVVFKVQWANHGIGGTASNRLGGFCLRNGNANANTTSDYNTNTRFQFYYIGGGQDSFLFWDGNGVNLANLGYSPPIPFKLDSFLLTADTYRLVIKDAAGVNTLAEFDNNPLNGSGTIDSVALFDINASGNQVWNNMKIFSASLTPPTIENLQPTNGTVFADTSVPFSFDVFSQFSTLASSGIQLTLNGVPQNSLSFGGSGTTNLFVTNNTPLQGNTVYNGTIVATDANGNHATNNFSFNTFLSTDFFVEAEDYNFSSGNWLQGAQPNQLYQGLIGSNGIDYLETDLSGTNNAYRPGDLPQVQPATDVDHDNIVEQGIPDYNLSFIQFGEWENYTRNLGNTNYLVFARMSGFGSNPTMEMLGMASALATTSNQPNAAFGTFVSPQTGGVQNYTFVQLKDFFSNPVTVNFGSTNTFRLQCVGSSGSYNLNYLIFVPQTAGGTLRPYLSEGFPFPNATGVQPDQQIHFTIKNRQTSVSPGTIQVFLNSNSITGSISLSNNAAGSVVTYNSPTLMTPGTNTLQAIFSDGSVTQTNTWQFIVANLPVLPTTWALPLSATNGVALGFAVQIAKAPDDSPSVDFPPKIAEALAQLAGTLTNSSSLQPYINIAGGPNNNGLYTESNTINYDITGAPTGGFIFNTKTNFPYVPAAPTNNYISLAANMYVQLSPGAYTFGVNSDDGFLLTAGPTPASTNLSLGLFDGGRGNGNPTTFSFIVQTNGLYPMRLIYMQGQFGGSVEFYSVNRINGTRTLINDQTSVNTVNSWLISSTVAPIPLALQRFGTNVVLSWSDPSFTLQGSATVNSSYTNITGATSPFTNPISGSRGFFRLEH